MKLSSNRGDTLPTDIFNHQIKFQYQESFVSNQVVDQEILRDPTTIQVVEMTIGYSPKTDSKASLLKANLYISLNMEKMSWYLHRALTTTVR